MHEMEVWHILPLHRTPLNLFRFQQYTMCSAQSMDQQPEIRWHMRPCLVDYLIEMHFVFRLRPETLYLTLNIIDRYVSRRIVYVKHYQLVGCAALWIAAKFGDDGERVPSVQDLVQICRDTYDESAFIQMEQHVLSTIQWTLGHPTAEAWLKIIYYGATPEDKRVQNVTRFLMEITLFYREFVFYTPSVIALASITLARYLCGRPRHVYEETDECLEVVKLLDTRLSKHVNDLSESLVKKYSYAFHSKASTFVVQYYLQGGHFFSQPLVPPPMTQIRSKLRRLSITTSTGISTLGSDYSDYMPTTPTSPIIPLLPSNDYASTFTMGSDKESYSSTAAYEPAINKDSVPEQYLPHDFVAYGRPVLHNYSPSSPSAV